MQLASLAIQKFEILCLACTISKSIRFSMWHYILGISSTHNNVALKLNPWGAKNSEEGGLKTPPPPATEGLIPDSSRIPLLSLTRCSMYYNKAVMTLSLKSHIIHAHL